MTGRSMHRSLEAVVGVGMLVHFAMLCAIKTLRDSPNQIWWISHVSLALAGIGLLVGSRELIATSLTNVLVLHGLWIADFMCASDEGL